MKYWIVIALIGALCAPVFAHQKKAAISTVLFNSRTQNLEVMHRFDLHDAEHAVKLIFGKSADIIGSEKTQQTFAEYVAERFAMYDETQQALPLNSIGYELEGKFFWVYQETRMTKDITSLIVKHEALRDLWPKQVNTVNFEGNKNLKTLVFDESSELLKVEFN